MARSRRGRALLRAAIWTLAVVWLAAGAYPAEARLLNIGGALSLNYNRSATFSKTDAGSTRTPVTTFGQNYSIALYGDYFRLGGYRFDVSWLDQLVTFKKTDQKNRFNVSDYRLSLNLFPVWSPLSLTRQSIIRKTDLEAGASSLSTKDRVDSFGANWVLNLRRIPRVVLTYNQSELKTDQSGDFVTRAASAVTDTSIGNTRIGLGYQFSETETLNTRTRSNGGNLDLNSQLTSSLIVTTFARYVSTDLPAETAAGVEFFEERSFGTAVTYRPHLHWWDGSASYNYSENPFVNDFRSQSIQGSANVRYNIKTNSSFALRYLHFSWTDTTVDSESGNASLSYRPIFGLSTSVSGAAGLTSTVTTGSEDTDSLFQNYRYNINYSRPWRVLQYRAAYEIAYGVSDTMPTGFSSRDLTNGVTLGIDNTNTRIVHVGLLTTYSDIQRITQSVRTDQSTYVVRLTADSSYFKGILLRGDRLNLKGDASYSDTSGFGVEGRVRSFGFGTAYSTRMGLSASGSYRVDNYPKELLLDRQILTGEIRYLTYLIEGLFLELSVKETLEDNRFRTDINRLEERAGLSYRLGKLSLGLDYMQIETQSSGDRYGTRSFLGRASRSF